MNLNNSDQMLRDALEASGQRFTDQRAAVFRYLAHSDVHPTADEVFLAVRQDLPGISLATVYKSLETLVGCGLAVKLTFADHSARYDGRTDLHHHARCVLCEKVIDLVGDISASEIGGLGREAAGFTVTGYRLELAGYCVDCVVPGARAPAPA
jgi:Fur family transcriptional regulator, peroxide stress response regulator